MDIIKYILAVIFAILSIACTSNPSNKYSKEQKNALLDTLANNMYVSIDDITSIHRTPSNKFILLTRSLLDSVKTAQYKEKKSSINQDDDIEDFVTYEIIEYHLINEKNQSLVFVEYGRDNYLQEASLSGEDERLYQNMFSLKELNGTFEQLKGNIKIRLEMPTNLKREIEIPVNISINDTLD
jgi:hypothetical protein